MLRFHRRAGLNSLLALAWLVDACTLSQLRQQEQIDQQHVAEKEAVLNREEAHARELAERKQTLNTDLSNRKLSLDEINTRLSALRVTNTGKEQDNLQLRQERAHLLEQLQATNSQLTDLQHDTRSDRGERQARIDYLKLQLKRQLDLLLH